VTAQTTASDGSTVQDSVTFYVEGTQSFDPTSQLASLYATGVSPRLMTGVAQHESTYYQFLSQNLLNATALWPHESYDGGSHIGLMMVPVIEALAWDWMQNTNDGVNSADHGFVGAKLPLATTWMNRIIGGNNTLNVPAHKNLPSFPSPSAQLENMALVLYGPASASWTGQYYIPVCQPPGAITKKGNTWSCSAATGWYWAVNDPLADSNVQAQNIFPPGTTGSFGNHQGILYVSNSPSDPYYDSTKQLGVRNQMH